MRMKTPNRTGMQQQKWRDMVACSLTLSYLSYGREVRSKKRVVRQRRIGNGAGNPLRRERGERDDKCKEFEHACLYGNEIGLAFVDGDERG